jgi:hypothetical protein
MAGCAPRAIGLEHSNWDDYQLTGVKQGFQVWARRYSRRGVKHYADTPPVRGPLIRAASKAAQAAGCRHGETDRSRQSKPTSAAWQKCSRPARPSSMSAAACRNLERRPDESRASVLVQRVEPLIEPLLQRVELLRHCPKPRVHQFQLSVEPWASCLSKP